MSLLDRDIRGTVPTPLAGAGGADSIGYSNARIPSTFNGTVASVLNYVVDALYPDFKGTVATPAALPTNASPNDFYLVNDDGDGKSAGYVWTVIQGSGSWVKRYDVDWSYEGILAESTNRTQYMYVSKYGTSDKTASGAAITGLYAGQRIYGGDQQNQSLTLTSNSYDGASGFIQCDNFLRPTSSNTLDLGTSSNPWRNLYLGTSLLLGTTTLQAGVLSDSSGAFSFGSNALTTTGTVTALKHIAGTMTLSAGSILDTSNAITFGSSALTTNGTITGATGSKLADITLSNGTLSTTTATGFSFSSQNISSVGTLTSSKVVTGEVDVSNLILSGQTLTTNSQTTNLVLQAGTGGNTTTVQINSKLSAAFDFSLSGLLTVSGAGAHSVAGTLSVASALKFSNNASNALVQSLIGDLQLQSTGSVSSNQNFVPTTAGTLSLGTAALPWKDLVATGNLSNGTSTIALSTLLLFSTAIGTAVGQGIFWDGSKWIAHDPATEIVHSNLLGLTTGDAGHTQFALLAGRSGGQSLVGGTAASDSLTLSSTANATKGKVFVADTFSPSADSVYSAGWTGVSLGDTSHNFNNIFSKGIHFGLRLDQYSGSTNYPASSGQNIGRVIFDTSTNQVAVDTGSAWVTAGNQKFLQDLTFTGSTTSLVVTVSGSVSDARTAIWQLCDNQNNFDRIYCSIKATSQTQVTITVSPALPAGSYRLIGFN